MIQFANLIFTMLSDYIRTAMRQAHYEWLPNDAVYYGEIPDCQGVYATAKTLETCREELQQVLEGWIILSIEKKMPIPSINSITIYTPEHHKASA